VGGGGVLVHSSFVFILLLYNLSFFVFHAQRDEYVSFIIITILGRKKKKDVRRLRQCVYIIFHM
jgi:hypothetical protein